MPSRTNELNRQQVDNHSMPFDFDPLSLDFPALTLQCLKPPPTLFSSTQHPTSTSWAVQTPGQREFDALQAFFVEEFRRWKITCASATTSLAEDLIQPFGRGTYRTKDAVSEAERLASDLENQVEEHLHSAYTVWECLPEPRQQELWVLELARGVGRKHKEAVKMKEEHHRLKQENENLKQQIDQLNRLQQPKEFKLLQPATIPLDREIVTWAYEQGVKGGRGVGFNIEDRHEDLATLVTKSIERWKNVITSTRATTGGLNAQKSLDSNSTPTTNGARHSPSRASSQAPTPQQPPHRQLPKRSSTATSTGQVSERTAPSTTTTTTGPPSIEEASDQDADAEMEDDDSFALLNPSPVKTLPSQQTTLDVPRTRGLMPQQQAQDPRFMMPNGGTSPRLAINLSRSMPNINMAMQAGTMGDMGMAMQGVRRDLFME